MLPLCQRPRNRKPLTRFVACLLNDFNSAEEFGGIGRPPFCRCAGHVPRSELQSSPDAEAPALCRDLSYGFGPISGSSKIDWWLARSYASGKHAKNIRPQKQPPAFLQRQSPVDQASCDCAAILLSRRREKWISSPIPCSDFRGNG